MSNRKKAKGIGIRPTGGGKIGTWYHFTSPDHLPRILKSGFLKTVESNIGSPVPTMPPTGDHVGPDVVWLLDTPEVEYDHGLTGSIHDKTGVRFTVRCKAERWTAWAPGRQAHPAWRAAMVRAGGGEPATRHWLVSERPIPAASWTKIEVRNTDGTWTIVHEKNLEEPVDRLPSTR